MKALLISSFLLLFNFVSHADMPTCRSLHTGNFKVTEGGSITTVRRIKNLQIEENADLKFKAVFEVTWLNECTYELRPKELLQGDPALFGEKWYVMTIHIKNIKNNSYTAEVSTNFFEDTVSIEMEIEESSSLKN
jgi:hypothetical protein